MKLLSSIIRKIGDAFSSSDSGVAVAGKKPDNTYAIPNLDSNGNLITTPGLANAFSLDAFYRQRVSNPQTIFDSKQVADSQPLFWDDQQTSGAGTSSTYNTNKASTTIAVGNLTAGTRVRQTFRRFNYQPGKSQLFLETGTWGASATGITKRSGLFDGNNGIFFQQDQNGMYIVLRTFTSGVAVDNKIHQNNPIYSTDGVSTWNQDKLDGTGASGLTLNMAKSLIWFADFEWLGVGTIRYGFIINGTPIYVHFYHNSNIIVGVYMSTPNLPLRYEISNNSLGPAANFEHICSTVIAEGGLQDSGYPFGITRGATPITTANDTNLYVLAAIRLKSTHIGSTVSIIDLSIACTSTAAFNYYIIVNPTIAGTALSFTGVTNSSVEQDVSRTNTTTVTAGTGTIIKSGSAQATNDASLTAIVPRDFALGSNIAGTSDIVVLAVQRVTGTTETFYGGFNIKDQQ